ncbi:MAG: hypothetical protein EOO41_02490, partial [Methanobacteriota archaeon]
MSEAYVKRSAVAVRILVDAPAALLPLHPAAAHSSYLSWSLGGARVRTVNLQSRWAVTLGGGTQLRSQAEAIAQARRSAPQSEGVGLGPALAATSVEQQIATLYDRYRVRVEGMQLQLHFQSASAVDAGHTVATSAYPLCNDESADTIRLLDPCTLRVDVASSVVPFVPSLPQFRVHVRLPNLALALSHRTITELMRLAAALTTPAPSTHAAKPPATPRHASQRSGTSTIVPDSPGAPGRSATGAHSDTHVSTPQLGGMAALSTPATLTADVDARVDESGGAGGNGVPASPALSAVNQTVLRRLRQLSTLQRAGLNTEDAASDSGLATEPAPSSPIASLPTALHARA